MKKFFEKINLMGVFMLIMCAVLGVTDTSATIMADTAITTPSGTETGKDANGVTTTDIKQMSPEILQKVVDEQIIKIRPTATPLDTILRQGKSKKTDSRTYEWWSQDTRPVETTITHMKLESGTVGGGKYKYATIQVADPSLIEKRDTLRVPSLDGGNSKELVLYVQKKEKTGGITTFTVAAANPIKANNVEQPPMPATADFVTSTSTGELTDPIAVYRMGNANSEANLKDLPNRSSLPTPESNYCQFFVTKIGMTKIAQMENKKIKWDMTDIEEQAVYEWKREIEASYLFGEKAKVWDEDEKEEIYLCGGIVPRIEKRIPIRRNGTAAERSADFIDGTKELFQNNSGNKKRIMFMGSEFCAEVSKSTLFEKQLEAKNTEVVWGITWNQITTNFGTLNCMMHDILDMYGFSDKAIVLDVDFLDKHIFMNTERGQHDLSESLQWLGDVVLMYENSGPNLKYTDCHAIFELTDTTN